MKNFRADVVLILALMLFFSTSSVRSSGLAATFKPWLSFTQGNGANQLLWLTEENGGILDGPFQGPMGFLTDKNGNLWVGDSLNARILAFDKTGRQGKEIDLISAAKQAGLASDPVMLDFAPGVEGRLLVADAVNNAILAVDIRSGKSQAFLPVATGSAGWSQINRVHGDGAGRIYIEDIATLKTVVLTAEGKPFCEPLDGEVGLAVANDGRIAMVVNDSLSVDRRQVVLAPVAGEPFVHIADLKADEPIIWATVVGFDKQSRLVVVFDTATCRHFATIDTDGNKLQHKIVETPEPGYDPIRPEWIGPDGEVYMVKAASASLEVWRLE